MSKKKLRSEWLHVHYCDELDPSLESALRSMLQVQPNPDDVAEAIRRLKLSCQPSPLQNPGSANANAISGKVRRSIFATAALLIFALFFMASTDAWAQVAVEYSRPSNEPRPLNELHDLAHTEVLAKPMSLIMRFVLIAHVALLLVGIVGMAASWIISLGSCFGDHWLNKVLIRRVRRLERLTLLSSTWFYVIGTLLGCLWSQVTWGRYWSWDPRESFGLFTVTVAALWLQSIRPSYGSNLNSVWDSSISASMATTAFGSIALMFTLGSSYAASLHSYGLPSTTIPTAMLGLFFVCLISIWVSFWIRSWGNRQLAHNEP